MCSVSLHHAVELHDSSHRQEARCDCDWDTWMGPRWATTWLGIR